MVGKLFKRKLQNRKRNGLETKGIKKGRKETGRNLKR